MGFVQTLVGRVPVFFVGIELILLTGSHRGNEGGFGTMPILGVLSILLGVALFGAIYVARN